MNKSLPLIALLLSACSGGQGSESDEAALANEAKALEAKANAEVDEIIGELNKDVAADEIEGDEAPAAGNGAQ